jgi:GT2 family glycosyltransferase
MNRLSILIPVHNGIEYTKHCIENLKGVIYNDNKTLETYIVVIDDGSTDGTAEWLQKMNYANIYVVKGNGSLWWSGGINSGARFSISQLAANYLLLWNNDILPDKNYFLELKKLILTNDNATIIGSKIYSDKEMTSIWSFGGFFNTRTGKFYMEGYKKKDEGQYEIPLSVDWLPGMGTVIPKSVIEDLGYWDDINFPQYHGDSDFTFRAKKYGYKLYVYPQLKIWNDVANTGIKHNLKFRNLIHQLSDIKSNLNLKKNFLFYKRYSTSPIAYFHLLKAYYRLFGGYIKWSVLNLFGISRKNLNSNLLK